MSTIAENSTWEPGIYLLEETDLVKAGLDGIANRQAQELANRSLWLKNSQRGFSEELTLVTGNKTLSFQEIANKLILVNALSVLQLPNIDIALAGTKACIQNNSSLVATISGSLRFDITDKSNVYLAAGESIELVWIGDKWLVRDFIGNLKEVGSTFFDYKQRLNTLVCKGDLVLRADYPRLWEFVQTLGASLITDAAWTGTPGKKGFFSSGNGSSNFRIPDLRSMFMRGLDLEAGIDISRPSNNPGDYEVDDFKIHKHLGGVQYETYGDVTAVAPSPADRWAKRMSVELTGSQDYQYIARASQSTGGLETRSKNIGLLPLIKV